jgi:hypothetical protein
MGSHEWWSHWCKKCKNGFEDYVSIPDYCPVCQENEDKRANALAAKKEKRNGK